MRFYLLLIAFSFFFCSTQQQKSNKNTIEKAQKSNENEILKIKYFYVKPDIPINVGKVALERVEITKNRYLIYKENYNEGVQLKNSIIVDIPFNADSLFSSIPEAFLNNAKVYPFLNFKNSYNRSYERFLLFRQKDTIVWNIKYQLLPEDFVFYKNFKEFRLEQLRNKRIK
ncbi:hypothetical protein JMN12_13835 [Capnocytophaga genosp. AHN8471]|uniref:Uncharacterized protein n=1 Tax=Capnocytophaga endodontalis TaxID=2708117 RepID=A0A1Z4BMU8_9FLAO|nr:MULTISPECIES: hypothetical protein [Capnocytophaga]ASF42567.1 hypothetical protein CBG49_05485 [Capnocytophaga endodontalis]MBM0657603.1 hypothetical protein [Capnocytophaga genosp. AHN8471]